MTTKDAMKVAADEFYEFPGDREFRKYPYWVARTGTAVSSRVDGRDIRTVTYVDVPTARAHFAEETGEPDGPGAPRVGDTIEVVYGKGQGSTFTVTSVYTAPVGFTVTGHPRYSLDLLFGQYRIVSRPEESR